MADAADGRGADAERSARIELSVRVGMLAGRYLNSYDQATAVATDAFTGWLTLDDAAVDVEQWWDEYVNRIESQVGGYECANTEQLERVWLNHADRLLG